jgi:hypothetical protein
MSKDSDLEIYNSEFFNLCQQRSEQGAIDYGELNFMKVNLPEYIYEELADMANYARFLFIRLRAIEEFARESGIDMSAAFTGEVREQDELPPSAPQFVPSKEVSRFLPDTKREG